MGYSQGPYNDFPSLPSPPRPKIHSSREIDPVTKRYVLHATTGGNQPMPSTRQRVILATAFNAPPLPEGIIDDRSLAEREDALRKSVASLTDRKSPAIEVTRTAVTQDGAGSVHEEFDWTDLHAGVDESTQLT